MSKQTTIDGKTVVVHPSEEYDYYVGRGTVWGNPYSTKIGAAEVLVDTKEEAVSLYRDYFYRMYKLQEEALSLLSGKRIACYCKEKPCHADVIADFVNTYKEPLHDRKTN